MPKKGTGCLTLLSLLLCMILLCQVNYWAEGMILDDLPSLGESLVIESDTTLTINVGETGLSAGVLTLQGTEGTVPEFKIVNEGDLTISNKVTCNSAKLTIQNNGNLALKSVIFTLNDNATLTIENGEDCTIDDVNVQVYGGYFYLSNGGSFNSHNLYIKDQYDGTLISNSGVAILSETNFIANGAYGKIEIFNSGDMQIHHGMFDVNYGGKVNINSATGNLSVTDSSIDISGASHGKKSDLSIISANATWDRCSFVNNGGNINYLNTGEASLVNCTAYNSRSEASTILSSRGTMVLKSCLVSGFGATSITNWDSMTLIDSTYNSSHALTFINNGELTAENWIVKTGASTAKSTIINSENGTIKFDVSFIEDVSSDTLTAIGSDGQEFMQTSGGTIVVTNDGAIVQSSTLGNLDFNLLYILAIAVALIAVIIILLMRKKISKRS
jgi:hypothetical protein